MSLFFAPRLSLRDAGMFAGFVAQRAVKRGYDAKDLLREIENLLDEVADDAFAEYKIKPEEARHIAKQAVYLVVEHQDQIGSHNQMLEAYWDADQKGKKLNFGSAMTEASAYRSDYTHLVGHFKKRRWQ